MPARPDHHPLDDSARLVDRTWQTVGAPLLLVPVGATEQHGPHLPLDTDAAIAATVAERLAARVRGEAGDAVVAPVIAYGSSGEHQGFPGTLSIGTAALQLMLIELARSASSWASRVVFVNAHGGNLDALVASVRVLRSEGRDAAWLPCAADDGRQHDAHAGYDETSIMAHLRAPDIRFDRFEPGAIEPITALLPRLRVDGVRAVSPNGVLGDPRGATGEAGEKLLEVIVNAAWRRLTGVVADDGRLVARASHTGEGAGRMSDPAFPPDGTIVRLNTHTRRTAGRVLVGGAPIRVSRVSAAAAERLHGRDLEVRDATSRSLARYLLATGMGELVSASLPDVSLSMLAVVIPVRDRPTQLARLLASIPAGVAEIVVVDDGSVKPGAIAHVAAEHGARLVRLPENRGPAAARNAGMSVTQTPYVAFVDSDAVLDEGALETLLRHLIDPDVALVAPGVRGLRRERETWLERYEDARSSLDLGPDASTVRPRSRVSWVSSTCLVARVSALGGGFDADLRVGEDVDLVWRLVAAGHRVTYDPTAIVRHEHRATLVAWMRRKFDYGTGAFGLGVRHPRDIAPVALPPWSIGLLAVTLAQRAWSVPVGVGIVAAFAARISRRIPHIPNRRRLAALLAVQGTVTTLVQGSALLVRHWWPLTIVLALGSKRVRRAALIAALGDAAIEYVRLRPRLDPVRFTLARRLDDVAYGAGVWWSSLRGRSAAALRPRVVRGNE